MARSARLVATGYCRTKSLCPTAIQQKYWTGLVHRRVDHHATELAGTQFRQFRRERRESTDLSLHEQLHRIPRSVDMRDACEHVSQMPKMIQIRNVPDDIHRALKVRAAKEGMTLSAYLLREVAQLAERPTLEELMDRARRRKPLKPFTEDSVQIIRELRGR
jgi:plasmid stability protein